MPRSLIILFTSLLFFPFFTGMNSVSPAQEKIHWDSDRQLSWGDFRGKPDPGLGFTALTAWAVGYRVSSRTMDGTTSLDVSVECYFDPRESWVKRKDATEYLLMHEQMHFNIGELLARDLRKRISETDFGEEAPFAVMEALYDKVFREYAELGDRYDAETLHGLRKEAQLEWNERILTDLKRLDGFKEDVK